MLFLRRSPPTIKTGCEIAGMSESGGNFAMPEAGVAGFLFLKPFLSIEAEPNKSAFFKYSRRIFEWLVF